MSILQRISELVREESNLRLHVVEPTMPGDPVKRCLVVSTEIWQALEMPPPQWSARCQKLRANLEAFVRGDEISLGVVPYKAKHAYMGVLDPPADGVWDIRSQAPEPGLRLLGSFAAQDVFVALIPASRSKPTDLFRWGPLGVGNSKEWADAINATKAAWRQRFHTYPPLSGIDVHDLISSHCNIVGTEGS